MHLLPENRILLRVTVQPPARSIVTGWGRGELRGQRRRPAAMEPKARSKGEIMMLRRQAAEDRRMTYERVKAADRKAFSTAQWQEKTDKKVAEQNITRRFNALRTQQQEQTAVQPRCASQLPAPRPSGSVAQTDRKPLNSLVFSRCTQNGSQSILVSRRSRRAQVARVHAGELVVTSVRCNAPSASAVPPRRNPAEFHRPPP